MYLKTIEIFGFKSFAERTRIDLKQGITGVIGPNGCGKSNIMESIRWCIGERSWKSLRSDSMVSIIFAGTSRRNPMNLAEVTLVFDNASRSLPVQYAEVAVTRRLYRSGESEYYINKTQCRQRDVRELFLDTGIGSDGYAILDQGGVDFVLKAKPEERRALFEEAAGVSKYKAKREEALRKLDRLEIDLGRLQDSVSLIEEQVKKLDSDARKAQLFKKYKGELASMEAGAIISDLGRIEEELASETERISPVRERAEALAVSTAADGGRLAALSLERTSHDESVVRSNLEIADLKSSIALFEERIQNAAKNAEDARGQFEAAAANAKDEERRLSEAGEKLVKIEEKLAAARAEFEKADAEFQSYAGEFSALTARREAAQDETAELSRKSVSLAESVQALGNDRLTALSRLGNLEYQTEHSGKELEKALRRESEAAAAVESLGALAEEERLKAESASVRVSAADKNKDELRAALSQNAEGLLAAGTEAAKLKVRIESLSEQGERDPYWVGAHAVAEAGIPGIEGTVSSLIAVEDADRPLLEDALGDRLYAVVCDDLAAARSGLEYLKGCGRGRARFLAASELGDFSAALPVAPEAKALLDLVVFDPRHEKVLRHLLAQSYSLNGALHAGAWLCGGSREGESLQLELSGVEALERRLETVLSEEGSLKSARAELESALHSAESELSSARMSLGEANGRHGRAASDLALSKEALDSSKDEAAGLRSEIERLAGESATLKTKVSEFSALAEEKRAEHLAVEAEKQSAQERLAAVSAEVLAGQERRAALSNAASERKRAAEFWDQQLGEERLAVERLRRQIEARAAELESWTVRLSEYAETGRRSKESLDQAMTALADKEKDSLVLLERQQLLRADAERLDASLKADLAGLDEARSALHQSELKTSSLKTRQEDMTRRLIAEWELSYEEAKAKYGSQPVEAERIEFLRRRIAALGNINMAAPEEYEELTKRRDSLKAQIDDINQAKQDLRSVIQKINSTTRENFRQTFTEVRENFRKLYGILFDGGEADLQLTDEENMLESGVEIVAQPPGKRLQSISQLSGGEKTLTAIALLMAFFMVRPSPMCMLDEADAALDDANVDRFISLIEEFKGTTQFLIVSHNKRTMESCDAMYGITMEESGISQLISVDFKKGSSKEAAAAESRGEGPFAPKTEEPTAA